VGSRTGDRPWQDVCLPAQGRRPGDHRDLRHAAARRQYLPLVAGWNWIGCFTDTESIEVSSLASTGGFSNRDQLKGKGSPYTTYYKNSQFSAWDGTLTSLEAGSGYKLLVARAGILSVATAEQTRDGSGGQGTRGEECPWTTPDTYANSMTLDAVVRLDEETFMEVPGSAIGVFDANGICRGVASLRTTAWGALIYSGQVWSNSSRELGFTLKLWNGETGEVTLLAETVEFSADSACGSAVEPEVFTTMELKPDWTYTLDAQENATIVAYNGHDAHLSVPSTLDGHPVVSIVADAFGENDSIRTVRMPIRIAHPEENIFAGCRNLTQVNYTLDGVRTDFGESVFFDIEGLADRVVSLTLNPGWNLVSLPLGDLLPESEQALQDVKHIFYYDSAGKRYQTIPDIETDQPYWIFTDEKLVIKVRVK